MPIQILMMESSFALANFCVFWDALKRHRHMINLGEWDDIFLRTSGQNILEKMNSQSHWCMWGIYFCAKKTTTKMQFFFGKMQILLGCIWRLWAKTLTPCVDILNWHLTCIEHVVHKSLPPQYQPVCPSPGLGLIGKQEGYCVPKKDSMPMPLWIT